MDGRTKLFNIVTLGPIILAPLMAVEFPRILAYLPALSALLGGGILFFLLKQKPQFSKLFIIFVVGILGLGALSLFWSHYYDESLERLTKLALLLPLYVLFFAVIKGGSSYFWCNAYQYILLSCGLGAALSVSEILTGGALYRAIREISLDSMLSTAVFNRGAVTITLMGMASFFMIENKRRPAVIFSMIAIMAMLFLVQSQSAQIAFIFTLLFYFLFPVSKKPAWVCLFIIFAAGLLAKPYLVQWIYHSLEFDVVKSGMLRHAYIGNRFEIWDFIAAKIFENPFVGYGLEFTRNNEFVSQQRFLNSNTVLHPHSFILQLWIEWGIIGIIGAIAAVGVMMRSIFQIQALKSQKVALTMLFTVLLVGCFSYGMWQSWWLGLLCLTAFMPYAELTQKNPVA